MIMSQHLLIIMTILILTSSYAIQGNWTIQAANDQSLTDQSITLQINEFIFRKNSIHHKFSFKGCNQFIIQATIQQNQIFFSTNTYKSQSIQGRTCVANKPNPLDTIFKNLKVVFYFSISIDKLSFNDPFGRTILSFKRIVNNNGVNINGIWNLGQYNNTRTSLSTQISSQQIVLCLGNAVYNYKLDSKSRTIQLIPVISNCPSVDLIRSLQSSKYFRLRNGILNLFDKNVTLTVQLIYSQAYDPLKPMFTIPTLSVPSINDKVNSISPSNIAQIWQIRSLFKIPLTNSKYKLQFTKNKIKLNGGCMNYQFNYQLEPSKQIINIEQIKSNNNNDNKCAKSDDQLYINGVLKMNRYVLLLVNGTQLINFYDNNGQIGYSLAIQPKIITSSKPVSNNVPASKPSNNVQALQKPPANLDRPFAPGQYLLLLLNRRDLPRILITIANNTITYKRCNEIAQTFQIVQPNSKASKIKIKGGAKTKIACPNDTDQIYYGTLNLVQSFTYDSGFGVIILKNSAGIQTVSITKA